MLLTASMAALLAAGPVWAQTSPGHSPSTTGPGTVGGPSNAARPPAPKTPAPNPLQQEDVSKLKGTDVYGADDKKIGDIETALMKPDSKTIDRLVVKAGGVLGIGGHAVAMPVDEFRWDADKGAFRVSKSEEDLKSMPEWKAPSSTASAGSGSTPASGSSTAPSTPGTGSSTK
jgi:sporulation protein YlmC with PRC-barrel domain